ncbi:DUF3772 domain-containing protein [Lutimaribacter sp. EGI FJ00015]|uniref:DUF3772 domain-containing protein n=1 Tax=Lutimaribacter degradans TaxID=2945989 RepID=A0ACC5ZXJ4_9RHOB|nr:DUF3772 domain-containing protein [Lutimaribacter sp. EGI FJ00013]MCM2562491.1 DUF3772 domain-containing protein [Lutimaribacter sp. EGI FJ00013]MCO0613648.1 DUF3772 domain-containing protein [Lutimaribacter sp. EGI FJ00015]MCO0636620.1 DUF3772 domain-containing protein [Lutimaribacter sp. EGI FJ00014]
MRSRVLGLLAVLALCLLSWVDMSVAQTATPEGGEEAPATTPAATGAAAPYDDPAWESLAMRTENALEAGRASNFALSTLREDLVEWRALFLNMQSANAGRIRTLQSQLQALGEAPAEGETEPERIASQRETLETRLANLRVPVQLATEAHTRADRLIAEIDTLVRQRWVDDLSTRVTSPLNPEVWFEAWHGLRDGLRAVMNEVRAQYANPIRRDQMWSNLPGSILLGVIGLVLLLRGRKWTDWLARRASARTARGRGVVEFILSLGKLVLPFAGALLLSMALQITGLFGMRGEAIVENLPAIVGHIIVARWLMSMLFTTRDAGRGNPLEMAEETLARVRRLFLTLAWVLSAGVLIKLLADTTDITDTGRAALFFPLGALAAVLLWRIGKSLRQFDTPEDEDGGHAKPYRFFLVALVGRGLSLVGIAAILLGILGYAQAFDLLINASTGTLFLLGALALFQGLVFDIYSLITRTEEGAREALVPILIGFMLSFAALPVLALIWGARLSDMSELWTRFREGFNIGATQISPTDFLTFVLIFALGYTATRLLQGALRTTVLPKTRLDTGGQTAVVSGLGYVGIFLAAVIAITTAGIDLSGLAIVAGALSVGIGFGLQTIVSNFVSGIILLIERPISQGDWIEVGGQMGYVRNISVRATRIETFDRTDVIIPNADLVSGTVTNYTRGNTVGRVIVPVGVAYGTDTKRVERILQEVAEANPMVLLQPPPGVLFMGFGADSLDFEIRAILRDVNWVLSVKSEMNHEIARRFAEEGIEIPFAQRDVWLRNPEVLRQGADDEPETDGDSDTAPPPPEQVAPAARTLPRTAHLDESDMDNSPDGDADGGDGR